MKPFFILLRTTQKYINNMYTAISSPVLLKRDTSIDIYVTSILKSPSAIFYSDGLRVFEVIKKALSKNDNVILSFLGIKEVTTAFLKASIGKAYSNYSEEIIEKKIFITGIPEGSFLDKEIKRVKCHSLHPDKYKKVFDEVLNLD